MRSQSKKLVQNFELKRIRGAPKDHQLTPLVIDKMVVMLS